MRYGKVQKRLSLSLTIFEVFHKKYFPERKVNDVKCVCVTEGRNQRDYLRNSTVLEKCMFSN